MSDYTKKCILESIKTMREACDTAERESAWKPDDIHAISRVMHALAWGHANATTPLIAAMNSVSRETEQVLAK